MAKITLNSVGNLIDATTAETTINSNFDTIETAFENTLSRDGTTPNTMGSDLDMNSNQILNLPNPSSATSPLRLQDLSTFVGGGTVANIPIGGTTGQALVKSSNTNYDTTWGDKLTSVSNADGSLTASTVAGAATVSLNPTHANTWTGVQTLTAPVLGTPASGVLTNATGLPITTGVSGLAAGIATFLTTPSSANLKSAVTDETGSGPLVFATGPSLSGAGATGGFGVTGGLSVTSGIALNGTTSGSTTLAPASATPSGALIVPSATDTLIARNTTDTLTNKTLTSPTMTAPVLGTPASGNLVNCTGHVGSIAGNTGAFTLDGGLTNSTNAIRLRSAYFSASIGTTSQSVSSGVLTKIQFDVEDFDPQGWYDNATNYRFTPQLAGTYFVSITVYGYGTTVSGSVVVILKKNGTSYAQNYANPNATDGTAATVSVPIAMNGSTDYIEGFGRVTASSAPVFYGTAGGIRATFMTAYYIGP